ncbi:FMN-binding protein [Schaalia meyeri]|uniref:FMN-binding protein n=1 Tax=Schaalia meyeri TaxID=52773 RepID=UPI0020438811|nr:FMN-binding protein [Schaalia meyeri]MCM3898710.1 FMN-binding protein [Schaalia meyeri]
MNRRSTPPSPSGSPRWGSVATYAALSALGATILAACQPSTGLDMSKPLNDGTWTAQSNADDQGSVGTITITVEGGRITATSYETTLADGTDKGSDYGKSSAGEVFNEDYYKKAQAAVASYQEYSENLTKVGDPAKVDVITGATVAHQQFVQAAIRAIAAAQGVSPDGADDIEIPGLNDATKEGADDLGGSDG